MHIFNRMLLAVTIFLFTASAHAWFFIFPIPNLAKPAPLQKVIDALEKSTETRALAYVSEDKTFGSKYWVWGYHTGKVSQEEANRIALEKCENSLRAAKAQNAGGQPLYDFGSKRCELHEFPAAAATSAPIEPPNEAKNSGDSAPNLPLREQDSPTATKLKELNSLLQQGLISEEEYKVKRRSVLESM